MTTRRTHASDQPKEPAPPPPPPPEPDDEPEQEAPKSDPPPAPEAGIGPIATPAPHTVPVFRVLRQRWREYVAGGNAVSVDVTTPPDQVVAATTPVAGTVYVAPGLHMPLWVTITLNQGTTLRATRTVNVNPSTGAYSTTFPANTLAVGTATTKVMPMITGAPAGMGTQSPVFNVT